MAASIYGRMQPFVLETETISAYLEVNQKSLKFKLDTGAAVSVISHRTWKAMFPSLNPNLYVIFKHNNNISYIA